MTICSQEIELEELVNLHAAIRQGDPEAAFFETAWRMANDGGVDGVCVCVERLNRRKASFFS